MEVGEVVDFRFVVWLGWWVCLFGCFWFVCYWGCWVCWVCCLVCVGVFFWFCVFWLVYVGVFCSCSLGWLSDFFLCCL